MFENKFPEIKQLQDKIDELKKQRELNIKNEKEAREKYEKEIDGSGGSKKYGIGKIAKKKEGIWENSKIKLANINKEIKIKEEKLAYFEKEYNQLLKELDKEKQDNINTIKKETSSDSFLERTDALWSLITKAGHLAILIKVIVTWSLLFLIEIVPIVFKLFLSRKGVYDIYLESEKEIAKLNIENEKETAKLNIEMEKRKQGYEKQQFISMSSLQKLASFVST